MADKTSYYQGTQQFNGPRPASNGMKFSVVIPAHNEAENIGTAIKALKLQNIDKGQFEIIVVDNNSTDGTFEAAEKAGADIVVKEPKKGTNMARQAGFKASKGDIVAFLDADSEPVCDWLYRIGNDLSREDIFAVSGPYDYGFGGLIWLLSRFYDKYLLNFIQKSLEIIFRRKTGVIWEGNFAAKREAIEKIGGLPPLAFWGDGAAIAMLISRRVGKILFDPDLIIKSSPRRLIKYGIINMTAKYVISYLKIFFSKEFR